MDVSHYLYGAESSLQEIVLPPPPPLEENERPNNYVWIGNRSMSPKMDLKVSSGSKKTCSGN
eukprot:1160154-Pelagomonas_calceolata.AAC.7